MSLARGLCLMVLAIFHTVYARESAPMDTKVHTVIVFETTQGEFEVTLNESVAPKACENFLTLVEKTLIQAAL